MLQHEPQTQPTTSPGQIRITPDELSRAVAAIEARKQEEAQRLAGTIPIEEAVSSLHLNATHEEIWAEVQAQREAEATARKAPASWGDTMPEAVMAEARVRSATQSRVGRRPWKRILAAGAGLWFLWNTGLFSASRHHTHLVPPVITASLPQIPDGRVFYCDKAALVQISKGKPPSQVRVAETQWDGQHWALVKIAGHIYLRAFTLPIPSLAAMKGQPIVLYNDDNSGALESVRTAQTTVRIDNIPLGISADEDDYTEITIPHFQPDQFTTTSAWR